MYELMKVWQSYHVAKLLATSDGIQGVRTGSREPFLGTSG